MYTVIIVDDNELTRKSIQKTIEKDFPGCLLVGFASDGEKGKALILREKPDIIISDIRMPNTDGLEMIKIVKEHIPTSKIIFITGFPDFESAHTAIRLNASAFILKPFRDEQLRLAINQTIVEMQKDRSALLDQIKELTPVLSAGHETEFKSSVIQLLRLSSLMEHRQAGLETECLQNICLLILRFYWQESASSIDLETETKKIYQMDLAGQSPEQQLVHILAYRDHLLTPYLSDSKNASLLITRVLQYIYENSQSELSLSAVAEHFSMNPSYLSNKIKKETGKNFKDLLIEERLRRAKRLLRDPSIRINEVSDQCGFGNYTYFYQVFHKYVGQSPKEYRNQFLAASSTP